ncbi:hypothetical protein SASPL_141312 [Salvia splendens]|uniref:Uncharacterized protein n=1 Tax=Salvia splendens TaxID=180675 RepID=A0A8X8ZCN7_SALSN|nr:hypothetical protein SASPL_141312 [Salvia splendens]
MKLKLVEYDPLSSEDKVNRSSTSGSSISEVGESKFMEGVRRQEDNEGVDASLSNVLVAYKSYKGATSEAKSALVYTWKT